MALLFKLDAIASIGSAVALLVFSLITVAHLRIRGETGANVLILIAAIVAAAVVLVTFVFTVPFTPTLVPAARLTVGWLATFTSGVLVTLAFTVPVTPTLPPAARVTGTGFFGPFTTITGSTSSALAYVVNPCRVFGLEEESGAVVCDWPAGAMRPVIPVP